MAQLPDETVLLFFCHFIIKLQVDDHRNPLFHFLHVVLLPLPHIEMLLMLLLYLILLFWLLLLFLLLFLFLLLLPFLLPLLLSPLQLLLFPLFLLDQFLPLALGHPFKSLLISLALLLLLSLIYFLFLFTLAN